MASVAIVTDSASDLDPAAARADGIAIVPLLVTFGEEEFRAGVDLSVDEFWQRLTAEGAPFPRTAACSPGAFQATFRQALEARAEGVVCITVGSRLSATHASALVARDAFRRHDVHVVDSESASLGQGMLVRIAAELAAEGRSAADIAAELERIRPRIRLYAALDTLEYLRRGGRISGAQAAIGSVLSVKPIITCESGVVETADRVRTRTKARERLLELLTAKPVERVAVIHGLAPDIDAFADELARRTGVDRATVTIDLIGPSVGPHVGPGVYGAVVLQRA